MSWDLFKSILEQAEFAPKNNIVITDPDEYRARFRSVLDDWIEDAADRLARALGAMPADAERVDIGLHTDQDGEGLLHVMVHLTGPDLHKLNNTIGDLRDLFCVRHTPDGLVPPVPLVKPFEEDFPTNRIVVEIAGDWALKVWMRAGGPETGKGGVIFGDPESIAKYPLHLP